MRVKTLQSAREEKVIVMEKEHSVAQAMKQTFESQAVRIPLEAPLEFLAMQEERRVANKILFFTRSREESFVSCKAIEVGALAYELSKNILAALNLAESADILRKKAKGLNNHKNEGAPSTKTNMELNTEQT